MHHKIKVDAYKEIDRIILLVGTGSFGISIAFLSFMYGQIEAWYALVLSWLCILLSLSIMVRAHEANAQGSLRQQNLINLWRASKGSPDSELAKSIDVNLDTSRDSEVLRCAREARECRDNAKYFLSAGIFFLLLFAVINFAYRNTT